MAHSNPATTPYWTSSATFPKFPKLARDLETEVLVVGGGATGLTTDYLLAKAGKRVVLLERDRCALGDTGHTSAHLTMVTDSRLTELVERFGRDHARAVWDAGLAAIATIDLMSDSAREYDLDPGFDWVDGYLHAPGPTGAAGESGGNATQERGNLQKEAELARVLGFEVEYLEAVPLYGRPGVRFPGQARLHVRRYLAGVAKAFVALGGRIFESSPAGEFCDEPRSVRVGGRTVRFEDVVLATHNPLLGLSGMVGATLFQTKLAHYTSYVLAGRAPKDVVPDALWFDTRATYDFLRLEPHRDFDVVIFGGEDHKTGQEDDTAGAYRRLEERLRALCPEIEPTHRWSGQVIATPDGLPYIGQTAAHQHAATGYNGNGLTFGTLAGMMISDALLERKNPWAELFDPSRKALAHGLWDYLKENADYPYYMIRDRIAGPDAKSLRAVKRGQGAIVERAGKKVAAYRAADGEVTLRSAICTHMGCTVAWNDAERTWDCPCHGSRFQPTGEVISGPAEAPLPPAE